MPAKLQGIAEVAEMLNVSSFTIRRLMERGHIQSVNVGSRRLIPVSEVERVLAEGAGIPRARRQRSVVQTGQARSAVEGRTQIEECHR